MAKEQAEQEEKEEAAQPPKEVGFISVSVGKGMTEIFKALGVDYMIEGGQTMNPSTEDMPVSYTHLDVYKRQQQSRRAINV